MTTAETTIERVGAYRVVRKLATGGTSDVLLAKAEGPKGFERTVVLKLLLSELRNDTERAQMFVREASAYARLSHASIVRLFDFFAVSSAQEAGADPSRAGQLCMVLEHIDGPALSRLRSMLKAVGRELDDKAAAYVACRIFEALAAAHAAVDDSGAPTPVIHRDVNPSNVLLPWDGEVKLADFGVAKIAGVTHHSVAGMIKGTYGYMAPEQVTSDMVTPRADVYAAAIILWELLTKRRAFQRGALPEVEALRAMAEPRLASIDTLRPDLDRPLRDALKRALEPAVERRTISATEMVAVLRASISMDVGREHLVSALSAVRNSPQAAASLPPAPTPSLMPRPGPSFAPAVPPAPESPRRVLPRPDALPSSRKMPAVSPADAPQKRQTASARLAVAVPDTTLASAKLPHLDAAEPAERDMPTVPFGAPDRGSSAAIALKDAIDEVLRGQPSSMPPSVLQSDRPGSTQALAPPVKVPSGTLVMERAPAAPAGPPAAPDALSAAVQEIVDRAEAPTVAPPSEPSPQTERMAGAPLNQTLPLEAHRREAHRDDLPTAPPPVSPQQVPAAALPSTPAHASVLDEPRPGADVRPSIPPRPSTARTVAVALILLLGIGAGIVALVSYGRYRNALRDDRAAAVVPTVKLTASPPTTAAASGAPVSEPTVVASTTSATASTTNFVAASPPASASAATAAPAGNADVPEGMGLLRTAGAAPGRRIFVDERVLGQTPETVTIKCGTHTVRLGSSGKPQRVDVPCRGEITVSDKLF